RNIFFEIFSDRPGFGGVSSSCAARRWLADATALCRGDSRWLLLPPRPPRRCHGLVPWWLTLVSTSAEASASMPRPCAVVAHAGFYFSRGLRADATALCRGGSRWFLLWLTLVARQASSRNQREPPRHKAVASQRSTVLP